MIIIIYMYLWRIIYMHIILILVKNIKNLKNTYINICFFWPLDET